MYYITIYAIISFLGLILTTVRWFVLYNGSIHASTVLYQRLLETVLFANIRFHDTVSRGRLLNRFGKDFEGDQDRSFCRTLAHLQAGIDSSLSDNFGRSIMYGLSALTTIASIAVVGGPPFVVVALVFAALYWNGMRYLPSCSTDN